MVYSDFSQRIGRKPDLWLQHIFCQHGQEASVSDMHDHADMVAASLMQQLKHLESVYG